MAGEDRNITWRARLETFLVERNAARVERALERLERRERSLGDAFEESGNRITRSQNTLTGALNRVSGAVRAAQQQGKEYRKAIDDNVRAERAHEGALLRSEAAQRKAESAAARLTAAEERKSRAIDRSAKANVRAYNAQAAYDKAVSNSASSVDDIEKAQRRNEDATSKAERATSRLSRATTQSSEAHSKNARAAKASSRANDDLSVSVNRLRSTQVTLNKTSSSGFGGGSASRNLKTLRNGFENLIGASGKFTDTLLNKIPLVGSALGALSGLIGALSAGFMGLAGAIGPVVGLLGTLPGLLAGGVTALGALFAGFRGVFSTMKAYTAAQKSAGTSAASMAKAQQAAAKSVKSAERSVASAAKGVRNAYRNIAASQRGVRDAYESAAAAAETSRRRIVDAEASLADAQKQSRRAQLDLNVARGEAIRQLDDMRRSARDAAFAEEEAVLSLADAKDALFRVQTDPNATANDLAHADLNYREAQARLEDARKAKTQAIKDNAEAQKKGVEGSDIVVSAQERIVSTAQGVALAQRDLSDAFKESAKSQRDSAQAIADALQNQQDANDGLKDAQQNLADSQQSLVDAQQNLADSFSKTSTAMDAYNAALAKLSPAGRAFVAYLISLKGKMTELQHTAEQGLLPGVEAGLKSLMTLFPMINKTLGVTAKIIGDSFATLGAKIASPAISGAISRIFTQNESNLGNFTRGINSLVIWFIKMGDAARPLTQYIAQGFEAWAKGREAIPTQQMADFFAKTKHALVVLSSIFGNLWKGFKNIGRAGENFGNDMLATIDRITGKWADWTGTVEGQNTLRDWFDAAKPIVYEFFGILSDLSKMILNLGTNDNLAPFLKTIRNEIIPNIQHFFDVLSKGNTLESLGKFLGKVSEGLGKMADAGAFGGLSKALDILTSLFDIGMKIFQVPGVAKAVSGLAAALLVFKTLKFASQATGLTNLYEGAKKLAGLAKNDKLKAFLQTLTGRSPAPPAPAPAGGGGPTPAPGPQRRAAGTPGPGTRSAGRQAAAGFAQGVRESTKDITNAGVSMARALLSAIKNILKIQSPSRALHSIGLQAVAGYVGGLRAGVDDASSAGRALGSAAAAGADAGDSKMGAVGAAGAAGYVSGTRGVGTAGTPRRAAGTPAPSRGRSMGGKAAGAVGGAAAIAGIAASFIPLDGILGVIVPLLATLATVIIPMLSAGFISMILPILGVVAVFAAIAAGLVLLFKNNKTFHDFVINAWHNIQAAISIAWSRYILPALQAFWGFITGTLIPIIQSLWNNVIKPVFAAIGTAIAWTWNNVIKPVFNALWGFLRDVLIPIFKYLWNNVVAPYFRFIGAAIAFAWNSVIKPVFNALWGFIRDVLGPVFNWLWNNIISPVMSNIGKGIAWSWNNVIKPVFDLLKKGVGLIGDAFASVGKRIGDAWSNLTTWLSAPIQRALQWVQENLINKINSLLRSIGVTNWQIGTVWSKPKPPPSYAGSGAQVRTALGLASGGRVPGSSPHDRADNIPAMLTAGEYVLPVKAVQKITSQMGAGYLENLRQGKPRRYASGGFVRSVNGNPAFPWGSYPSGAVHRALDIPVPIGTPVVASENGTVIRSGWDTSGFGNHIRLAYTDGNYMILGHLSQLIAKEGQKVIAGQLLGYSGNTGRSTGPHVHVEMRRSPYDPNSAFNFSNSWYNGSAPPFSKEVRTDNIWSNIALGAYDKLIGPIKSAANNYLPKLGFAGNFLLGAGNKMFEGIRNRIADFTQGSMTVPTTNPNAPRDSISSSAQQRPRTTGEYISAYANGGRVPGTGNSDTVPAMLTPGEYVLKKSAVRAIGLANLNALNGGPGGETKNGISYYNAGGPVMGHGQTYKEGGAWRFINIARMLLGWQADYKNNKGSGLWNWDWAISKRVRDNHGYLPGMGDTLTPNASPATLAQIAAYINGGSTTHQRDIYGLAGLLKMSPLKAERITSKYAKFIRLDPRKRQMYDRTRSEVLNSFTASVRDAQYAMNMPVDGKWSLGVAHAFNHMLAHGSGAVHGSGPDWPTPWPQTAIQTAVQQQDAANALQREYNGYLDTFSQWGLGSLVDKLLDMGPQDGINIARASVKDKASAVAYNKSLETEKQLAGTSSVDSYKFVAYLNSSTSPGIRSSARELGVPDYAVVQMWDKLVGANRINPTNANFSQMLRDISLFRKGLFYAATGGQVPGTGSGDTVPAMLTPGEFVLRKSAVRALGIDNVRALNSTQYFANGGPVFNPQVGNFGGISSTGLGSMVSRIAQQGSNMTTVNINTTINNPVAERSSQSINKVLRRQVALKTFGAETTIGKVTTNGA